MKIRLTEHFKFRLKMRNITEEEAKEVYSEAQERYHDNEEKCFIAVKKVIFKGKERDMMVAYDTIGEEDVLFTIHPLKKGQKENRVNKGRWTKI